MGVVADLWFAASLCTYTLVPLLFVTFAVFPYSARPGLPIVQLACPSTFIQIGWVLMATCFFVSWSLSPDVAEGSDALCTDESLLLLLLVIGDSSSMNPPHSVLWRTEDTSAPPAQLFQRVLRSPGHARARQGQKHEGCAGQYEIGILTS